MELIGALLCLSPVYMSLEDFLADLAQVSEQQTAVSHISDYHSHALSRFQLLAQSSETASESLTAAASLATDFHKEISDIAEILKSRLATIGSDLASLFPKNSELIRVLVDIKCQRSSDAWLDRARCLALSTSLATTNQSAFLAVLEELSAETGVLAVAELIQNAQKQVTAFLSEAVVHVAPSLLALLDDAELVARLILAGGGLTRLAAIPSDNLVHVGKEHVARRHGAQGILASSHLVTTAAISDQQKILKTLANKCGLAARMDAFRTPVGNGGSVDKKEFFKEALEKRLKTAPLQPRTVKPLPVPAGKEKTHRAGKRVRKKKELVRKRVVASRVTFGTGSTSLEF